MHTLNTRQLYNRRHLNRLLRGLWQHPLTVVEAPMGYGKTTAVREFLRAGEARVLWQTVFAPGEAAFWHSFSRLFAAVDPACAASLAALGVPGDSALREESVELIGGITFAGPTAVVVDDYHLLASAAADRFFERLAKAAVPGLHIVIVSRTSFGGNGAELALKGYCLRLGRKDFELTPAETAEYCRLCGIRLKPAEAAFLQEYAEGWISAVYLCILGCRQTGRLEQQPASLHELVEKVVYQPATEATRDFLVTISIFDAFTLPQAEHIWLKGGASALLARLTAENAFIAFDPASGLYSLHNILTGYLRGLFDRLDVSRRRELWKAAGEWHLGAGDYNRAMDYFYKAGDFERLMSIMDDAINSAILNSQPKEMRIRYFQECPAEIKLRHPRAGFRYAHNLFMSGEPELFARQCGELASHIEASPALNDGTRRRLRGELKMLIGMAAYNDLDAMYTHFLAAWELLQGPSSTFDAKASFTLGAPSVLYMYYRESGRLEHAVRLVLKEMPLYYRLTGGQGSGGEHVLAADRHYQLGDFDSAEIGAYKALNAARTAQQHSIALCANFLLVRLALVRGDWASAAENLRAAREATKRQALYIFFHTLDLSEGFVYACLNQGERIPEWIARGDLPDTLFTPCHAFCHMLRAKALLIGGRHRELAGIAGQLAAAAGHFPNLLALIHIRICEAAAQDRLGRRREALATLAEALDIAAPDQVIMPFVENGGYIDGLLAELQAAGRQESLIAKIREIYPPIAASWREIAAGLSEDAARPRLTGREADIAALAAAGLSNQAIGQRLGVAAVTVNKTLQKVFAKLGVGNRTALARVLAEQPEK